MRDVSIRTIRPAPIFKWPTSLLPICPARKPTYCPDASINVFGQCLNQSSKCGVRASAIALPSRCGEYPNPSRTIKTRGVFLALVNSDRLPHEEATDYRRKPGRGKIREPSLNPQRKQKGARRPLQEKPLDRLAITVAPSQLLELPDRFQA